MWSSGNFYLLRYRVYKVFILWPLVTSNDLWPPWKTIGHIYSHRATNIPSLKFRQLSLLQISCLQARRHTHTHTHTPTPSHRFLRPSARNQKFKDACWAFWTVCKMLTFAVALFCCSESDLKVNLRRCDVMKKVEWLSDSVPLLEETLDTRVLNIMHCWPEMARSARVLQYWLICTQRRLKFTPHFNSAVITYIYIKGYSTVYIPSSRNFHVLR